MSSPDHNYCDKCGEKSWFRHFIISGSMENDGKLVDICPMCLGKLITYIVDNRENNNLELNKNILKWIKNKM